MKNFKVGIQLYTLREEMAKDMEKTLKAVKEMGYDYVEFAGYFNKSAEEIKDILNRYDLEAVSVHQGIDLFEEEGIAAVEYLKALGVKYSAIPWYNVKEFYDNWDATIERFKTLSRLLKDAGIKLLYHNHDFEFQQIGGEFILDKLYKEIPKEMLMPQLDTCWVHYAGVNPSEYILKYAGRIDVLHIKDFVCEKLGSGPVYNLIDKDGKDILPKNREDNGFKLVPVGSGIQNWKEILKSSEIAGVSYLIVEQDNSPDREPIEAARMSREYLKSLGI